MFIRTILTEYLLNYFLNHFLKNIVSKLLKITLAVVALSLPSLGWAQGKIAVVICRKPLCS